MEINVTEFVGLLVCEQDHLESCWLIWSLNQNFQGWHSSGQEEY